MNPTPQDYGAAGAPAPCDAPTPQGRGQRAAAERSALRRRVATLVGLLEDPSPSVWNPVRRELERLGRAALPKLRRAANHPLPLVRSRARALLFARGRRQVLRRLTCFAARPEIDLERGLFLLARLERPELDLRPFLMQLDAYAAEVLRRIEDTPPTLERSLALVDFLAREQGFTGDREDYHHPDNVHLHRVLEKRRGMPLSLAAVHQFVGRRAGIRSALVPLPGHVLLRVRGGGKSALIDVFHGGEKKSERDLLEYLASHNLPFQPSWFRDADDATMFQRQVNNLRNSYARRGLMREARGLSTVLAVLDRRAGQLAADAGAAGVSA